MASKFELDLSLLDDTDSDDKVVSSANPYDLSADTSTVCSGISMDNLISFLQTLARIYVTKLTNEQRVISMALEAVLAPSRFTIVQEFIQCLLTFVQDCFRQVENEKGHQTRAVKIEKIFANKRSTGPQYIVLENAWDNMIFSPNIINDGELSRASKTILQHTLQHFWSSDNKWETGVYKTKQCTSQFSATCRDESESETVRDHAGWSIKRARDVIMKGQHQIPVKENKQESTIVHADKSSALAIISHLGQDVKQGDNSYRFVIHQHVIPFFAYLHSLVEELLNPMNIASHKGEVILHCLSQLAINKELRQKWLHLVPNFDLKATTVVLQRIVTFFVKSKQQIVREKEGLKPNKNSFALRKEIKASSSKNIKQRLPCLPLEKHIQKLKNCEKKLNVRKALQPFYLILPN